MLVSIAGVRSLLAGQRLQHYRLREVLYHDRNISVAALCWREWPAQIHAPAVKQPFNRERVQLQRLSVERRLDALTHFTPADHLLSCTHDAQPPVIDE